MFLDLIDLFVDLFAEIDLLLYFEFELDFEVFDFVVFGIFVELENTVEGLIRFENLGDEYFIYDEERKRLIGEKTNTTYKIGDKVKIRVISANKMLRQIDFEIVK